MGKNFVEGRVGNEHLAHSCREIFLRQSRGIGLGSTQDSEAVQERVLPDDFFFCEILWFFPELLPLRRYGSAALSS
jgi:hypothetical protein